MILLPIPKKCEFKESKYVLSEKPKVFSESEKVFNYVSQFYEVVSAEKGDISFKLCKELEKEEYILEVSEASIEIKGGDEEALFRGAQTLKQIILQNENGEIPCVEIQDKPDIERRGIMLDVSRGRIQKPEELKRIVDIMADIKYNELQLYFDTNIFEYKSLAQYYKKEEVITVETIKELEKYCADRFIELVPNQNSLGHMRGWIKNEEFLPLGITRDDGQISCTLNPLLPESLEFVDRIYNDLLPHFSSEYLHIGMDEPFELGQGETKEFADEHGVGRLYVDFLKKVCKLASEKYNKRPMFWDDIVMKHPEYIDELPSNAIVVDWGYEADTAFDRRCRRISEAKLDYYVAPGTSNWQSVTGRGQNMLLNIESAATSGAKWGAMGFLLTDWCDDGGEMPQFMSYIPYAIGAAYSWNSGMERERVEGLPYKSLILNTSRAYMDKFVFKSEGDSFSKVLYKINKTCNFEQDIFCNMTQLSRLTKYEVKDIELNGIMPEYFEEIEQMLKKRKVEGAKCKLSCEDGELIKKEFELLCDIAIFSAEVIQVCAGEYNDFEYSAQLMPLKPITERFVSLWRERNLDCGHDIYTTRLENMLKKIERVKSEKKGGASK